MPNDGDAAALIRALIDRGHLDQIVISHDICYSHATRRAWAATATGTSSNVLPLMRRRGFSESEIDAILVGNPRRLLTIV